MDQPDARRDEIGADGVLSKPFSIEAVLRLARRPAHPAAAP